jgi:hypothetical protein
VSTDPEFAVKAAEVAGLYLNPPLNALVISVDEKPSIPAIQRPSGYVPTGSGAVVRAMKSTYKRNGTWNLFAALQIPGGQVFVQSTKQKKRKDFRRFMDSVVAELPAKKDRLSTLQYHYQVLQLSTSSLTAWKSVSCSEISAVPLGG